MTNPILDQVSQGAVFTSSVFQQRKGQPLCATLECELLDRAPFRTQAEARLKVFDFIEGFYNTHRRHWS